MKIGKIYATFILASLATGVSAQNNALHPALGDAGQGRFQLAQAAGGPNNQGASQGGQSGPASPGKAPSGQGGQPGQGAGEHHHGPPPAAIAACKGLASGAGCSFVGRQNQNLSGTCYSPQADRPLACRPAGGGRGGQGGSGKGPAG